MLHIGSYRLNLPVVPNSESFWTQCLYNSQNSFGGKMKVFEYVEGPRPGETRGQDRTPETLNFQSISTAKTRT